MFFFIFFPKNLVGIENLTTFASAFGEKPGARKEKRSLKGLHKDREVVQEVRRPAFRGMGARVEKRAVQFRFSLEEDKRWMSMPDRYYS